ncbi:MAG TPA: pseudouridine synthase [Nitrospiria bacterium]|nr:pseudouridine synthase [Nitrospiria bacterium]
MKAEIKAKRSGLARILSKLGYCSRTEAAGLIRKGKVKVNDRIIRDPEFPISEPHPPITVNGISLKPASRVYYMIHKPKGVVTTRQDERGRKTVFDLFPPGFPRVFPVGRLDKESSGLLLLTNDTDWGNRISAPESKVPKTYHVKLDRIVREDDLASLRKGLKTEKTAYLPIIVKKIKENKKSSWAEITLREGRNRQIRNMFDSLGYSVEILVRIQIGRLPLGTLKPGEIRPISALEVKLLLDKKKPLILDS